MASRPALKKGVASFPTDDNVSIGRDGAWNIVVFPDCVFDAPGPKILMNFSVWSEFNTFWRVKLTTGGVIGSKADFESSLPRGAGETVMVLLRA